MKKFIFIFVLLLTGVAKASSCNDLMTQLSPAMKKDITQLTWVDVNPLTMSSQCHFDVRYYPCNDSIKKSVDAVLPNSIMHAASSCRLYTRGINHQTEGYCTVENIVAYC